MKRIIRFVSVLLIALIISVLIYPVTCAFAASAASSDTGSIINEQKDQSGADSLSDKTPSSAQKGLKSLGIDGTDTASLARFTPANLFKAFTGELKNAAQAPLKAVAAVLGILIICALLESLKDSFSGNSLHNVFNIVSSLCIAAVILAPVSVCVSYCASVIKDSSAFMNGFLPVFCALATASGHPASAIASQGILLTASGALAQIAATTFVPMVDIYLGFCIIGSVSPNIKINGVAGFIKNVAVWGLGLCLTIYTGILTIQGLISAAADNVTMKAAKFVVEGTIPVIGGAISDAMNTVISCAGLLKTATGAYAIIVFILAYLPPVLECALWLLAVDLSVAAADMLGIGNLSGLLKSIKEALKLLMALVLAGALTMIISVSVMLLVGMGN